MFTLPEQAVFKMTMQRADGCKMLSPGPRHNPNLKPRSRVEGVGFIFRSQRQFLKILGPWEPPRIYENCTRTLWGT